MDAFGGVHAPGFDTPTTHGICTDCRSQQQAAIGQGETGAKKRGGAG